MTDHWMGFTVALDGDIREDDCGPIRQAILALRGVKACGPVVATPADWIGRAKIRAELEAKLFKALEPEADE